MAVFNEILAGRFNRALQKLFQIKGPPSTPQLASEIIPTIRMDDFMALEHRILLGVRSFTRATLVAAGGAGNRSAYRFRNPTGSNVVAILEKVQTSGTLTDQPFLNRGPTGTGDLTTLDTGNVSIRDLRMGPISSALVLSFSTAATVVGVTQLATTFVANSQADGIILPSQEIVVAPGDLITLYSNTLNQQLNFTVMWRERALEESETLTGV